LEILFDTSHRDALAMIKIEEKLQYFLAQRQKGSWRFNDLSSSSTLFYPEKRRVEEKDY